MLYYQLFNFVKLFTSMAFVYEAARMQKLGTNKVSPIGPGHYFINPDSTIKKQCAPFKSSVVRNTFYVPNQNKNIGPGDYELSKPIVQPNITTVTNSQNIIVKINSTGTSQFKSACKRFSEQQSNYPGPGEYYYTVAIKREPSKKNERKKMRKIHLSARNYPTIPQRGRGLSEAKKEEIVPDESKRGPAAYNPILKHSVNSTGAVWGKDKIRRFSLDQKSKLGPGKYCLDIRNENRDGNSSNFKSATARTYFDSLLYKTNIDEKVKQRKESHYYPKQPAPGQYNIESSSLRADSKPFQHQFFGSTVERFPEGQVNKKKFHFYNIRSQFGVQRSFNKALHSFNSESERNPTFLGLGEQVPGPGHYKEKVTVDRKLIGNKLQKFGSSTLRPFHKASVVEQIGPGKYNTTYGNGSSQEKTKKNEKKVNYSFQSNTPRQCFGPRKAQVPFAQYQINHYDLSNKMQKQKIFIDNLRKIEVQKPPFESSDPRFPHYEKQSLPVRRNEEQNYRLQQFEKKKESKDFIIEELKSQSKVRGDNGFFGKEGRFKQERKGAPGVGSYTTDCIWNKKSYNSKYQQK